MSVRQALSTKAEVRTDVILSPVVSAKLSAIVAGYAENAILAKVLDEEMTVARAEVLGLLELEGVEKCEINGLPVSIVRGVSSRLDPLKFVELGGSLAMLKNAEVVKPKRAYVSIRVPDAE